MKKVILLLISFSISLYVFTQNSIYNLWYFGEYAGIDFSYETPTAITGGQITGLEGCATICDNNGNLLFYSDGQEVYNANHEVMENGNNLMGHWSSAQSALILKKRSVLRGNDSKQYYLFTTDDSADQHLANGWRYSVIDMSLDGGLGAVTTEKNILLEEMVTERQIAVPHSNNQDIWLIGHKWNSNEFIAYLITEDGISETPVISAVGPVNEGGWSANPIYNGWVNAAGFFKTNIDGNKLAVTQHDLGQFELYDFDNSTGIVSNYRSSSSFVRAYGIEFSPDGTKLYGTYNIYSSDSKLIQYNLEADDPFANYEVIATCSKAQGLQLGPNGKIYVARFGYNYLGEISYPDESGANCGFNPTAVYLGMVNCKAGLPTMYYYPGFSFTTSEDIADKAITSNLFPNPVKESLTIEYDGNFSIQIFNISGQLITTVENQKNHCSVDCSEFKKGIYTVNILSKDKIKSYKIVKI